MTVDNGGIGGSDCGGGYDYNNARGGGVCVAYGANYGDDIVSTKVKTTPKAIYLKLSIDNHKA